MSEEKKITAITSTGDSVNSNVDEQFGRCKYFVIIDPAKKEPEIFENPARELEGGAGPKAA